MGECTEEDIREIRNLIITNENCKVPNFNLDPWNDIILVTPRNCVHNVWNQLLLHKHCKKTGNTLYVCDAEDTIGNNRQPTNFEQKVAIVGLTLNQTLSTQKMYGFEQEKNHLSIQIQQKITTAHDILLLNLEFFEVSVFIFGR